MRRCTSEGLAVGMDSTLGRIGVILMPANQRGSLAMTTSKKDASLASKQLKDSKSTASEKSVAGSDLSAAKKSKGGGGKKK